MAPRATARGPARRHAGANRSSRDRCRHRLPSPRTSRPRVTTGRSRCSGSARGTWRGRCRSEATHTLELFAESTGIPVGQSQAGKGSLAYDRPQSVGAIGSTGTTVASTLAAEADVVIGIGIRYQDFTTASRTALQNPVVRFVNVNVANLDAVKHAGVRVLADARETLVALTDALDGWSVNDAYRQMARGLAAQWDRTVDAAYHADRGPLPSQAEIIGAVNDVSSPRDVVVCVDGSMPGDLHKLWRTRDPKGYHVEYGDSCTGYEIAGGMGAKMGAPDRDVYVRSATAHIS